MELLKLRRFFRGTVYNTKTVLLRGHGGSQTHLVFKPFLVIIQFRRV